MPLSEQIQRILLESINNGSRKLNLVGNDIGDEGATALAAELKQMPNLTSLNLARNNIGDNGARDLAEGLKDTNITSLYLVWNDIGKEGVKALAEGLKQMHSLTSLNLAWNDIGDNGAKALAEGLKDTNITSLSLVGNKLGNREVRA